MDQRIESQRTLLSRAGVRWSAIFGGWLFAYAFAMLLYLLGAAVGMTSLAAINDFSKGVTIGTGIWMVVSWIVATYIGAMFAGRSAGATDKGTGVIHGLLVWALAGIMTLFIGSVQAAAIAQTGLSAGQGAFRMAQQAGQAVDARGAQPAIPNEIQQSLSAEFKEQASYIVASSPAIEGVDRNKVRASVEQLDDQTITDISSQLIRGNTDQARQTLADRTELSEEEINRLLGGLSARATQYGNQLRGRAGEAVEEAGDVTSVGLWALFLASLLGLGAGAAGGAAGTAMAAKAYAIEGTYIKSYSYEEEERNRAGQQVRRAS